MQFKKGDKIVCKKDINFYDGEFFAVGETAIIIGIWDKESLKSVYLTFKIKNIRGDYEFGINIEKIKEYFYTPKEYRLKKLQQINNSLGK